MDTEDGDAPRDQPIINIAGEKIALGPLCRDLLPLYLKWDNDCEILALRGMSVRPRTWEEALAWYERAATDDRAVMFTIYAQPAVRPIGLTMLLDIQPFDRTADLGIFIGERDCWEKGYGTEATSLTLDYGFIALGLHNILLRVASFNERAIRTYTRAGFRVIGRRRQSAVVAGQAYDDIYMDCLATEFDSPVLRRLLSP